MNNNLPSFLTNMALIIEGRSRAGMFDEVKLPSFRRKVETKRIPGTSHPVDIDMGPEGAIELELTGTDVEPQILNMYGICNNRMARVHLKSAYKQPMDCKLIKHEVIASGIWTEVDLGSQKIGENVTRKYKLSCRKFRYLVDSNELMNIDALAPDKQERALLGI